MSISDHRDTIEKAARIIVREVGDRIERFPLVEPISMQAARQYARALAGAGLLAPAPLQQEWGIRWHDNPDDADVWDHYIDQQEAERGAGEEGTPVTRWVTDWQNVEGADQ